jgi:hypothetical protein
LNYSERIRGDSAHPQFLIVRGGPGRAGDLEETMIVVGAVPASKGCSTLALELRMSTLCTEAYNVRFGEQDPRTGARGLGPTGIAPFPEYQYPAGL